MRTFWRNIISRPTPRLLSFALCLECINGIYNTPDTGCLECYRPHASLDTTTPGIDRKHINCRNMPEIRTRYMPWKQYVNDYAIYSTKYKMSINGKQVKTAKITQIIPWFPRFQPQKLPATHSVATGHMREQWPLHGDNAYQRRFEAAANSLTAWKWVVVI